MTAYGMYGFTFDSTYGAGAAFIAVVTASASLASRPTRPWHLASTFWATACAMAFGEFTNV
jgi:hypothetical protein